MASGILITPPGLETVSPALVAWSLNHWTIREVLQINDADIFSCVHWPFACSLEKYLFGCSDHFWLFLVIEFCEFFVYFVYEPLVRYIVYKCFLSFGRLLFHFASVDEMVRTELPGIRVGHNIVTAQQQEILVMGRAKERMKKWSEGWDLKGD